MAWYQKLINTVRSERLSKDIDRELEFHIAERIDELIAAGMSPRDARRIARRQFGNYTLQTESTRDMDILAWIESLFKDVKYAVRLMRRSPVVTSVAVLSLALGIGANTAIFSLIDAVMLKSLQVNHPEQLLQVTIGKNQTVTNPIWELLRDRQDVFSGVFAYSTPRFNLSTGGESRYANGYWVSGDFFSTLGIGAIAGRTLNRNDDRRGAPAVAVLNYPFWQKEYGGDRSVVGRTISLEGHPFEIVGVAEPGFYGVEVGHSAEIFTPISCEAITDGAENMLDHRSAWWLEVVGRPKPGVTPDQVQARLSVLSPSIFGDTVPPNWRQDQKQRYLKYQLNQQPAARGGNSMVRNRYSQPLIALMIICGIVLLIACANVANLLLARASARQREIAIRMSLGSGRGRLIRQLLTESILLSITGAAVGLLFSQWGSRLLVTLISSRQRRLFLDLSIDARMLLFTLGVAVATGILFGLAPAWRAARIQPQAAMKADGWGGTGSSRVRLAKVLVVLQVSLSAILVVSAGLMLNTFQKLTTLDPGFRRDNVLLAKVDISSGHFSQSSLNSVYENMLGSLRSVPGVASASASMLTPVSNVQWDDDVIVEGFTPQSRDDSDVYFNRVSDRYFETLGTPLLAGRDFTAQDKTGSTRVAIVNERMVRKFYGSGNALGKTFQILAAAKPGPPMLIVGIVKDAKYRSLRDEAPPTAYVPVGQDEEPRPLINFEFLTAGPPTSLIPGIKGAISSVNPQLTIDFTTLDRQLDESLSQERLLATLSGFFGGLALLLAAIGLYGMMSYNVTRRRNEIGIRMALGAERGQVLTMIMSEAGTLVVAGLVIGLGAAIAVTRLVASFLYGIKPSDLKTFLLSAAVLVAVAILAGFLPARRASRLDPARVLREE